MADTKEYRDQLFRDVWEGKIPDRVPITQCVNLVYAIGHSGMHPVRDQYSLAKMRVAIDKVCADLDTDVFVVGTSANNVARRITGSKGWVMGSEGFMQHPNVEPMREDEYPKVINDYAAFQAEINLRGNAHLENATPEERELINQRVAVSNKRYNTEWNAIKKDMVEKYQFSTFQHQIGMSGCPFDSIPNGLRSFTGVLKDIRRRPDEVLAALRVITDNNKKIIDRFPAQDEGGRIFMPLHMATFMKQSDFEKFWWPYLTEILQKIDSTGRRYWLYCEDCWDRYMDFLQETPAKGKIAFEKTNPKLAKEKLGSNHVLSGMFNIENYRVCTPEEAADKTKEFLDIVAPGGNYYFKADKTPLVYGDAKMENMQAVLKTVKEYGKY